MVEDEVNRVKGDIGDRQWAHRRGCVAVGSTCNHSFQTVELLQVSRLYSGNTRVGTWQPDSWRWCDEFCREQDPGHPLCLVSKRKWRQAMWRIQMRVRSTLRRSKVIQRTGR